MKLLNLDDTKLTLVRMLVIAVPSYAVAFMTEKVFYVVPTIAMTMIIASAVEEGAVTSRNRLEDDVQSVDDASGDGLSEGDEGGAI